MPLNYESLVATITQTHDHAQRQAVQAVNTALTLRNWLIGYHIVEYEQHGRDRAQYGERLPDNLTKDLRRRLGRGFGRRNLFLFREFYLRYPIVQSLIAQFGIDLPAPSSVTFAPLEWQDDTYFARLFRELPWTHFEVTPFWWTGKRLNLTPRACASFHRRRERDSRERNAFDADYTSPR